MRNMITHKVCNFVINHVAKEQYRVDIRFILRAGYYEWQLMHAQLALADSKEERDAIIEEYAQRLGYA